MGMCCQPLVYYADVLNDFSCQGMFKTQNEEMVLIGQESMWNKGACKG